MEIANRIAVGMASGSAPVTDPTTLSELPIYLSGVSDIETAKATIVGRLFDDVWVDYDTTGTGDAKTISDGGGTQVVLYPSNTDSGNHPIWYDPLYCTDVGLVEDALGVMHIGATLMRRYYGCKTVQFDAKNTEIATEAIAQPGVRYCGLTGSTYTWLSLSDGDAIPYASYTTVYRNRYANTDIIKYGHNRYETSAIRQYLNADGGPGTWWEQKHAGQVAPSQLITIGGYLRGCSQELRAVIHAVKHTCASNTVIDGGQDYTVCDLIYLPSNREMYGISNTSEGSQQTLFWQTLAGSTTLAPSNSESTINAVRKLYGVASKISAANVWLRSASVTFARNVWYVTSTGGLTNNNATNSRAPVPACVVY